MKLSTLASIMLVLSLAVSMTCGGWLSLLAGLNWLVWLIVLVFYTKHEDRP